MVARVINKQLAGLEDLLLGTGSENQSRNGSLVPISKIDAAGLPYEGSLSIKDKMSEQITVVETMADMFIIDAATSKDRYVLVLGDTTPGDGRGGLFWNDTDDVTSTVDSVKVYSAIVGRWKLIRKDPAISANKGDINYTINEFHEDIIYFGTNLTADRVVSLPSAPMNGMRVRILRETTDSYTLDIGPGLFSMPSAGYLDIIYNSGWKELINTSSVSEEEHFNGNFESVKGTAPVNWTLAPLGTIAIDSTDQASGTNSLKFTSTGSGGGTATSVMFPVVKGGQLRVLFNYKVSIAGARVEINIKTFDKDKVAIGSTYMWLGTGTFSLNWQEHYADLTLGASVAYAQIELSGVHPLGSIGAGVAAWFDNIRYIVGVIPGRYIPIYDTGGERGQLIANQGLAYGSVTTFNTNWTRATPSQLANTGAKYVVLQASVISDGQFPNGTFGYIFIEPAGGNPGLGSASLSANNRAVVQVNPQGHIGTHKVGGSDHNQIIVPLNAIQEFDYYMAGTLVAGGSGSMSLQIVIIGYYT